jgi:hypothetical protein
MSTVTIVVVEFINNCHVFEKLKIGPSNAHITTTVRAIKKAAGCPAILEVLDAN